MIDISDKDFKILEKITASQRKSRKKFNKYIYNNSNYIYKNQ